MRVVDASRWMTGQPSWMERREAELRTLFAPAFSEEDLAAIRKERAGKVVDTTKTEALGEKKLKYGRAVKAFRVALKMTQRELAEKVGTHRAQINMIEAGFGVPNDRVDAGIQKAFGISWKLDY